MTTDTPHPSGPPADAEPQYDTVVVGGGAAGLAGALTLARARRSVLVVDDGRPRNAPAAAVHGYPTRDGVPPQELLAASRAEAEGYGAAFRAGTVLGAERLDGGGFRLALADGTAVRAARLLVATGLVDELPEVPGLAERWGRDVLHCPYCHGWEARGLPVAVLATGPLAVHQAQLWRQWTDDVTLILHTAGEPTGEEAAGLAARGIAVVPGEAVGLETADGALTGVRLADGRTVDCRALVVAPRFTARGGVPAALGLEPVDLLKDGLVIGSRVEADATGATAVPGLWVAGNAADPSEQVVGAAAAGVRAAAAINADLVAEEVRRAVAARRDPFGAAGEQEVCERVLGERRHGLDDPAGAAGEQPDGATAVFWDSLYGERERIWSGRANGALVREVTGERPGRALDLGCGEGADAVWLAEQGWRVTAVDISAVALGRAAEHAREAGVAGRIEFRRADLAEAFPEGSWDLVCAQYLHSEVELPRDAILRRAAAAVAPGGTLLVVGHAGPPSWQQPGADGDPGHGHRHGHAGHGHAGGPKDGHGNGHHADGHHGNGHHADGHHGGQRDGEHRTGHGAPLPTPAEVHEALGLPAGEWELLTSEEYQQPMTGPDGRPAARSDNTLKLRRLPV
ncbi:FAD-dependent oxidoreductase [Streptomyces sp. NRRL B-24484]|uniref:FAD-dependent oxidoreductase n=1 Tax=Streptomyces sp. NRRL B-24484 TaxID=1463833 RepID=UPI0004C1A0C6|nr:bifunctional NAD(P)/FAD-dependent oxidoreductase/class I SAM-dependent methyltransferase [Streptomyces sp. NRRL B-24484]